ncbi:MULTISPECIES: hypothetical protein [unclassified Variovorax]|uniref:hypothetical protein n=1 Tax=unclassified Variovorax TaxID=663243 RepID=UPI00076D6BB9|nr:MULTISPECIES: hypothetical protein [unclassified Variovorax]KWT89312.1 hypothetical protein APY03_3391 [Variovorax sp. WDL1]PNG56489.1 hypothetical protein CHC07_02906 [Variovorax sp. B4]PNG57912.1 hypothetical protein CHC06_02908 [Variovorax sp. B2]VTV09625.1 hypothetical protein WDL1CHR_00718 [Variovorax sp. WDL1]
MSTPTFPEAYRPPRVVNGRLITCRLVEIGCAHELRPPALSRDAEAIQGALLEPRTARPLPLINRIAGAVWRWC